MEERKNYIRQNLVFEIKKRHQDAPSEDALQGAHLLEGHPFTDESAICTYFTRSDIVQAQDYFGATRERRNRLRTAAH